MRMKKTGIPGTDPGPDVRYPNLFIYCDLLFIRDVITGDDKQQCKYFTPMSKKL